MTSSFHSFVYVLFIDILRNLQSLTYLSKLVQFLVFFIEEELFVRENFLIFQKILEFVLIQAKHYQSLQEEPFPPLAQAIKMIRFFIPKTDKNYDSLV